MNTQTKTIATDWLSAEQAVMPDGGIAQDLQLAHPTLPPLSGTKQPPKRVDAHYFRQKLQLVIDGIGNYNTDELARELARLAKTSDEDAARDELVPSNPLDMRLPCDITVGHGTIGKGCKLSTLVARMKILHKIAMENHPENVNLQEIQGKENSIHE